MMRALVLSATHETKVNSSGTQVPLPLVDIHQENEPYLTTLVKRLSALAELEGITVVTNDAAMRTIFMENHDNLLVNAGGKIFINCATVTPHIHREVYQAAEKAGAHSLEACMASSISHAREGKLYLMLAGDEAIYKQVLRIIEDMSVNRRFVAGGAGKAAEVKALVQFLMNPSATRVVQAKGMERVP